MVETPYEYLKMNSVDVPRLLRFASKCASAVRGVGGYPQHQWEARESARFASEIATQLGTAPDWEKPYLVQAVAWHAREALRWARIAGFSARWADDTSPEPEIDFSALWAAA